MFKLVIQDDEGKTTVVPLIRDEITIGRKEGNTIRLTERNVSRRHARIARSNGEVTIEDLGSYNGIRVNNARIAERIALRLSDQVQIGDYKLYLKSEAVEAIDDGKTVPHERVDGHATAVMTAVGNEPTQELKAVEAPTAQFAAALPTQPPGGHNLGNSHIATAGTDPAGRPVASAAAVAAMNAPAAHARLVVLSSNFAGEEFELTRPQMFIGRTGDNDIVLDHRSISRNHAKVVRSENGRYTVTDSQSANGLRVNGHDYSKHELKRGDVVDLGHVRLRFVEAGEEFVLGRDAQITDVPEGGTKKGIWIAVAAATIVLGGVSIVMAMKGGNKTATKEVPVVAQGSRVDAAVPTALGSDGPSGSGVPGVEVNAGSNGSNGSNGSAFMNGSDAANTADQMAAFTKAFVTCEELSKAAKWTAAADCAQTLAKEDGPQSATASEFATQMRGEVKNQLAFDDLKLAVSKKDYAGATAKVDAIDESSTYKVKAAELNNKLRDQYIAGSLFDAKALSRQHKCNELSKLENKARAVYTEAGDAVKNVACEEQIAITPPTKDPIKTPVKDPIKTPVKDPVKPTCDVVALELDAQTKANDGQNGAALRAYEAVMRCSGKTNYAVIAGISACKSNNDERARYWFKVSGGKVGIQQSCFQQNPRIEVTSP